MRYYVYTWDTERQDYTPQDGVPEGPYTRLGLRQAIQALRDLGYPCNYSGKHGLGDPSVLITSEPLRHTR